ncbi:MAG TPA: aldo/keto reductase [Acidimicrobiaceae bacterium]|nr:aldo/keto reductase [Acidimicrobiaceae bacterium]
MEHVRLGRSGLPVSRLCLGTMTFGLQCDEEQSRRILDKALDGGIDFLDTADAYPLGGDLSTVGRTEEILGRQLAGKRQDVVLATKCFMPMGPHHWDGGMSAKHILDAVDGSLRRLQTDYVDLYQLHFDDRATPLEETLRALDAVVRAGKVRYIGVSNWAAWRLALAVGKAELLRTVPITSVQPRYNLLFRANERDLFPLCLETGVGVIPYNPIAGGLLSGKHSRRHEAPEGRFTLGNAGAMYRDRYWHDREFDTVDALRPVAEEAGVSMVQLALGWVLAQPAVTAPIVGASRPEQLDDALAAASKPLDAELVARLDELTDEWRRSDAVR